MPSKKTTGKTKTRRKGPGHKDRKARSAVVALYDVLSEIPLPSNCDAAMAQAKTLADEFRGEEV